MPALHEQLEAHHDEILRRYVVSVTQSLAPSAEAISPAEILDHVPSFLDDVIDELKRRGGQPVPERLPAPAACEHGAQRCGLGFSIGIVVRDYGFLRGAILDVLESAGATVSLAEYRVLSDFIAEGIAVAAAEYTRQRDEAFQRQTEEHFAFLAHELRNQIASVFSGFSLLQKTTSLGESRPAQIVERNLAHLTTLLDGALVEVHLRAGLPVHLEALLVRALLDEIHEDAAIDAGARGLTVRIDAPEDLSVNADPKLLRSAVTNIFRNAVKFTRMGGTVVLRGRLSPDGGVRIEVEDACGGLDATVVEALFQPFVQAGGDRSGFGLGLAITKQAMLAQGGRVSVHNLPGQGCVFALELPP